jgi:poly(A) polymerase
VQARIYPASDHEIDFNLIDADALWVVRRLREAGYSAYIVGGSIRDMLAKRVPKDFDISTSALPEQIRDLFGRRCILIGKRFRLAHIRFGHHKYIEVSTFRSGENDGDLIVRDNQWGTEEEDVLRRDFTINGLFYDPESHTVIDYVGGWDDAHTKLLRCIGDPLVRFKQDPVRMIRLLKFQARLDFNIDEAATKAIQQCREEITKSAPARILEEMLRMLESGYSAKFFKLLDTWGFLELIFPSLTHFIQRSEGKKVYDFLEAADQMHLQNQGKTLDRAILTSCLLYPVLEKEIESQFTRKNEVPHIGDILMTTNALISAFVMTSFSHFPRRLSTTMGIILSNQYRLTPISGKRHPKPKLLRNKEFGLSLLFLKIRALLDNDLMHVYDSWNEMYHQCDRTNKPHSHPKKRGGRPPSRPRHAKPSS